MADQEQIKIIKKGAKIWNEWRKENPHQKINLSNAILNNINLRTVNLSNAKLNNTILSDANLSESNIKNSSLRNANLRNANLSDANLSNSNLSLANLRNANLWNSNLWNANLSQANFNDANLSYGNLTEANLWNANLSYANLRNTNFTHVNLSDARLFAVIALSTNFEGANLTGVCIQDWNINNYTNLDKVICEFVYLRYLYDDEEDTWNYRQRRPKDPNIKFAPGEFSKLFYKSKNTVELVFEKGISWKAWMVSFQKLQNHFQNYDLSIYSFENTQDGIFTIKLKVPTGINKNKVQKYINKQYTLEAKLEEENKELADLIYIAKLLAKYNPNKSKNNQNHHHGINTTKRMLSKDEISDLDKLIQAREEYLNSEDEDEEENKETFNIHAINQSISKKLNKLPIKSKKSSIVELLSNLQKEINTSEYLFEDNKTEALEQVDVLLNSLSIEERIKNFNKFCENLEENQDKDDSYDELLEDLFKEKE